MKKSIYNIGQELETIFNQIEDNGGEITPELETALTLTQEQIEIKGIKYAYKILSIKNDLSEIDNEIDRLKKIKEREINLQDRLKFILDSTMKHFGIDELKTPTLKVNFRKSESIEIENEDLIDDKFKVEKVTKSISKTLIKEAIKNGENVLGANISVNYNLQIK